MAPEDDQSMVTRLRLEGPRFVGRRLPVDALIELQRFERLIASVAATQWEIDNPGRAAPQRLRSDFQLTIIQIDEGSATPVLERSGPDSQFEDYYDQAEDTVELAFQALIQGMELPQSYDWSKDKNFKDFGDSLEAGELVEFRPNTANSIIYSADVRRDVLPRLGGLTSAPFLKANYIDRISVVAGRLYRINADSKSFGMRPLHADRKITGFYEADRLTDDLRKVLDSTDLAPIARFTGEIRFNSEELLLRIMNLHEVELFEVGGMPSSSRLIELTEIDEGWDGGTAHRVEYAALDAAREVVRMFHENRLRAPGIFPTIEGGVLLEWASPAKVVSSEIDPDGAYSLLALSIRERTTRLLETTDPNEAFAFLVEETRD